MKHVPALYSSPIDLPEGNSGKLEVRHSVLEGEVRIIGQRQALVLGLRPTVALLPEPRRLHTLQEEDRGVWMTDLPEELNQIAEMLATVQPKGDVLVGGLGLGILPAALSLREGVEHITVVERSADVIKLCAVGGSAPGIGYEVVESDILDYVQRSKIRYDYYLLDTWQSTSEGCWWSTVMPLKRAIRRKWGDKPVVHCWAEDMMNGQIMRAIANGNRTWYYECLPEVMSPASIRRFTRDVGLPEWEKRYGAKIDTYVAEQERKRKEEDEEAA